MIQAQNISIKRNSRQILDNISLEIAPGECVGLIGPNGAGKTSLMRAIMGFDQNAKGQCTLWDMKPKARAASAAWLAQERFVAWELTVEEVVALGRLALHQWRYQSDEDKAQINRAIAQFGLEDFRHRHFHNLSGGERARVLLARVLAQNTPYILADEPIDALDPAHQLRVMSLLRNLADEQKGVLFSIHDLGLAARFCTRLIMLDKGELVASGNPEDVLDDKHLANVFGIEVYRAEANGPILQPIETVEH